MQHALRLIAFGKLHLVLGVDALDTEGEKASSDASSATGTKREADASAAETTEDVKKRKVQA